MGRLVLPGEAVGGRDSFLVRAFDLAAKFGSGPALIVGDYNCEETNFGVLGVALNFEASGQCRRPGRTLQAAGCKAGCCKAARLQASGCAMQG